MSVALGGDAKKVMEEMKASFEDIKAKLGSAEELSTSRLAEVEELLNVKKELGASIAKYESGDIPTEVLERATLYVKMKRDYEDNRRQLLAMATDLVLLLLRTDGLLRLES